jgi:hypothetical protein
MVPPFFIVSTQQSISAARWWKRPGDDNATKMIISMVARLEYELVRGATDVLFCFSPMQIGQRSSLLVADTADDYLLLDGMMSPCLNVLSLSACAHVVCRSRDCATTGAGGGRGGAVDRALAAGGGEGRVHCRMGLAAIAGSS